MPKQAPEVQPIAWQLTTHLPDFLRYVPVLRMPAALKNGLRQLSGFPSKVAPVTSLYDALAAFAPEILAFTPIRVLLDTPETSPHWLYVYPGYDIHTERLKTLIDVWLRVWRGDKEAQHLSTRWFEPRLWSWDQLDLNTAPHEIKRRLLPALIARYLAMSEFQLQMNSGQGHMLTFEMLLAPLMDSQSTAQMITRCQTHLGYGYAFVLRSWLEILPPDNTEVLMQRVSVRRWLSKSLVRGNFVDLPWRKATSVYWKRNSGYLSDGSPMDIYTRLRLKQVSPGVNNVLWVGRQAEMLSILNLGTPLPEASDFVREPQTYQPDLLAVKTQQHRSRHSVQVGVWSNDHRGVFEAVTPLIETFATPLATAHRTKPTLQKVKLSGNPLEEKDLDAVRYQALCSLPHPIRIELYLDDTEVAKQTILKTVGAADIAMRRLRENPFRLYQEGRLLLEIVHGEQRLSEPLPANSKKEYKAAMEQKRRDIARMLSTPAVATGALVKLADYRKMKGQEWQDPKEAIRLGLADRHRVSKFCTPEGAGYETRLKNAIRSLLQTLGFRLKPLYQKPVGSSLPEKLDIFALWIFQRNALRDRQQTVRLPVVVHVPHGQGIQLLLPSPTNSPIRYENFPEGIIAADKSSREFSEEQDKSLVSFFRHALADCNRGQNALLLFWEPNTRRAFDMNHVTSSLFPDGTQRIRIARLRFSQNSAAPMCVPTAPYSKYPGLYQSLDCETLFYSLHNVGHRPVLKEAHKFIRLNTPAVNPGTCLIWMTALQPEDQPREWAGLIHKLRAEASHTGIPTQLPQPLHDLKQISKYLSRYIEDDIDEEADEE